MIDTDSVQYMRYGSGILMRPDYRHKEIVNGNKQILFMPKHQNFAFSVLLFKMLVCGTGSPLYQKSVADLAEKNGLFWGEVDFPYKEYPYGNMEVNAYHLENWKEIPVKFQRTFIEVFTFKRAHSIGHMIHAFDEALREEH